MPSSNRSEFRDVHLFHITDRSAEIGGLILTPGITHINFYEMVEIITIRTTDYTLQDENGATLARDNSQLQTGNYYINSPSLFEHNPERVYTRSLSLQSGTRVKAFTDAIRSRDQRCVITQQLVRNNNFNAFEAAHILPLAFAQLWNEGGYNSCITTPQDIIIPRDRINSLQNGLLLRRDLHTAFDYYDFSINPNDNYKIVFFDYDANNVAGTYLDQRLLNDPERPADKLLEWHFRQAVLANMRGAGEPRFEHDFPPGSDMVGQILAGPKAAERMEFELFNRFSAQLKLSE